MALLGKAALRMGEAETSAFPAIWMEKAENG
jgi:hypothetical protein